MSLPAQSRLHPITGYKSFGAALQHARDAAALHYVAQSHALVITCAFAHPGTHRGIDGEINSLQQHLSRPRCSCRFGISGEILRPGNTGRPRGEAQAMIGWQLIHSLTSIEL